MTDYNTIDAITRALMFPAGVTAPDQEQLQHELTRYPFFTPVRYALAGYQNNLTPLATTIMGELYPYSGNWLQLYQFLKNNGFESVMSPTPATADQDTTVTIVDSAATETVDALPSVSSSDLVDTIEDKAQETTTQHEEGELKHIEQPESIIEVPTTIEEEVMPASEPDPVSIADETEEVLKTEVYEPLAVLGDDNLTAQNLGLTEGLSVSPTEDGIATNASDIPEEILTSSIAQPIAENELEEHPQQGNAAAEQDTTNNLRAELLDHVVSPPSLHDMPILTEIEGDIPTYAPPTVVPPMQWHYVGPGSAIPSTSIHEFADEEKVYNDISESAKLEESIEPASAKHDNQETDDMGTEEQLPLGDLLPFDEPNEAKTVYKQYADDAAIVNEMRSPLPEVVEDDYAESADLPATIEEATSEPASVTETEQLVNLEPAMEPDASLTTNFDDKTIDLPEVPHDQTLTEANMREAETEEIDKELVVSENKTELAMDNKDLDNLPAFAPLYQEDYFSFQGIKVSDELPEDIGHLATEQRDAPVASELERDEKSLMVMMSFTEWLLFFRGKSEKEKHDEETKKAVKALWQREQLTAIMEEEEDEEIPEQVFDRAINSIAKEEDLVSEPLAEVYCKQGKFDKAIDMYLKLSLRNPEKNAYFAQKIEEILKEKEV